MKMTAVVQLLVLALLVVHSQGQSEGVTGLVSSSALTEWGVFARLAGALSVAGETQTLHGISFKCNGNITKWIIAATATSPTTPDPGPTVYPALGIYRERQDGNFDRVGYTIFVHQEIFLSRVYELTLDTPLPFQTNDHLGVYNPGQFIGLQSDDVGLYTLTQNTDNSGPVIYAYQATASSTPAEGVQVFEVTRAVVQNTFIPLVSVEIETDDPANAASCTRDFVSPGVIPLLGLVGIVRPNNQQIVFPSHSFISDGSITGWTLAAQWVDEAGRSRFPELQIWRRRMSNPNIYDRIASTLLTAALESSNQLYSDTIDPPLPFQSGDVLGMYLPIDGSNGARLLVNFGIDAGSIYETRNIAVPLSSIVLGQEVDNDRVFLALETSLVPPPTEAVTTTTEPSTLAPSTSLPTTGETSANPPTTGVTSASPPIELPVIAIAVGASVGGVVLAAVVIVLIIVVAVVCIYARKKSQNPKDRSVGAIDMTPTAEVTYDYPYPQKNAPGSIERVGVTQNEAYATAAPNVAYGSSAVPLQSNRAYGGGGDADGYY